MESPKLLHLELKANGKKTVLMLSDSTIGGLSTDSGKTKLDGWKLLFEEGLKTYVENPG